MKKQDHSLKAGIIGYPLGHSLSPRIHEFWMKKYEINGKYNLYSVSPDCLEDTVKQIFLQKIRGVNVTVPHKEKFFPLLDTIDEDARKIGAVNLVVNESDQWVGKNTDHYGFMAHLKSREPQWNSKQGSVVVLGSGGAARAVIYALLKNGTPRIRLINRTQSRSLLLAQAFADSRIIVGHWSDRSKELTEATLLVNTTTLGMKNAESLKINLDLLPVSAVVYDLVYNPLRTDLLRVAYSRGNPCVDGLGMLLHQAALSFEAWFGISPEIDQGLVTWVVSGYET